MKRSIPGMANRPKVAWISSADQARSSWSSHQMSRRRSRLDPLPDPDQSGLEVRAPDGAGLLPKALRLLDGHDVAVTAAEVRRPSLDDVLALTGERAASATRSHP